MPAKTYYSKVGLSMPVTKLQYLTVDGQTTKIEPVYVDFARIGQDKFFMLTTDNPEYQAVIEKRMAIDGSDIFGPEEYNRLAVPAEMRAKQATEENQRLLTENNRLLAMLNARSFSAPVVDAPDGPSTTRPHKEVILPPAPPEPPVEAFSIPAAAPKAKK